MSQPTLLGDCTVCSRHVFRRDDHPESPEWFRPTAKAALIPHKHSGSRIGKCSLCMRTVHRRHDGTEGVKGASSGRLVEHKHAKPFEVIPETARLIPACDDGPEEYRYWHDQAPAFLRPFG